MKNFINENKPIIMILLFVAISLVINHFVLEYKVETLLKEEVNFIEVYWYTFLYGLG